MRRYRDTRAGSIHSFLSLPLLALILSLASVPLSPAAPAMAAETACTLCHGNVDEVDEASVALVGAFEMGVHAGVGLSCHDCHGGNPDPALADDMDVAMNEGHRPNPFLGVVSRRYIPEMCGSCHSNPTYMKRYRPDIRVDQAAEYWTSQHGVALRAGDQNVATCTDCHDVHGILRVDDAASPVYPTRIATTCSECHSDRERMAGYTRPDGSPLPVDQFARWEQSVHANAMFEKGDVSAPTCNDCHGNHGAMPPGLSSIAFVCGQCHGREAELFRGSPKMEGFANHNEYMLDAEGEGCAACHEPEEPQSKVTGIHEFTECTSCHNNHAIVRPTVAMLSPLPETPCSLCHEAGGDLLDDGDESEKVRRNYEGTLSTLLAQAEQQGLAGSARFDWLVDQALELYQHSAASEPGGGEPGQLRPEFQRLFEKFRIGKTQFAYVDPATGMETKGDIVRCDSCHAPESILGDEAVGAKTSAEYASSMAELMGLTSRAERILLSAKRGGVEIREAEAELDEAVDASIELQVLVHQFSTDEGGPFAERQAEGIGHAQAALAGAQQGLTELGSRRRGLMISLVFILVFTLGLAIKIRQG